MSALLKVEKQSKVIGIIGGVGPSATADLYKLIIQHTKAKKDQDHIRIIIDSHPQIPDRTKAILDDGESPIPYLLESAELLYKAGASFLICPCNTAHYFLAKIKDKLPLPFINMIEEVAKELKRKNISRIGLLSTAGTAKSGIYQKTLIKYGINTVIPSAKGITDVMKAIYGKKGIKAGVRFEKSLFNKKLLLKVIYEFKEKHINHIIMGCTEIPLCLSQKDTKIKLINPTEILAISAINRAKAK